MLWIGSSCAGGSAGGAVTHSAASHRRASTSAGIVPCSQTSAWTKNAPDRPAASRPVGVRRKATPMPSRSTQPHDGFSVK